MLEKLSVKTRDADEDEDVDDASVIILTQTRDLQQKLFYQLDEALEARYRHSGRRKCIKTPSHAGHSCLNRNTIFIACLPNPAETLVCAISRCRRSSSELLNKMVEVLAGYYAEEPMANY
eukprot:jgi/Phyca11/21901/fgenesh1_pg.PHYCAscaffold_199_\